MHSVPDKWDETFDVLVAGTGAGGLAAALVANGRGANVLIVEKAATTGGTTKKSAGFMWVPNNHFLRETGTVDSRDGALRYMARLSRPALYDPEHETLGLSKFEYEGLCAHYDNAAAAITELVGLGAIDVSHAAEFPDFYSHLPEDETPVGRTLFPTRGGGGPTGGAVLIEDLRAAAERAGIEIRLETSLADLVVDDSGAVVGAVLGGRHDGVTVRTRYGVIGATGSFAQNEELRRRYLNHSYVGTCTAPTNTGDFLGLTREVGADIVNMNLAMQTPILVERIEREGDDFRGSFILPGDGSIVVNRRGVRVCSETGSYHDIGKAFFQWDPRTASYPNTPLIVIWDQDVNDRYGVDALGNPVPAAGADPYWVITADTLEELETAVAARLAELGSLVGRAELDADFGTHLRETLARYARFAETGVDEDFGRGSTPAQLALGSFFAAGSGVNPTMRALSDSGPYYAAILGPGLFETVGGAVTDKSARVVRRDGSTVRGLYGVGTSVAGPWAEAAWSGGVNVAYALTSGYRAAVHAAGRKDDATTSTSEPVASGI
jgi:succinate dehydrogenase/fumarate reductase flavoprotein subunit